MDLGFGFFLGYSSNLGENNTLIFNCNIGDLEGVRKCIENGEDINIRCKDGRTPLITACINKHVDVVELLLKNGADHSIYDESGNCALHHILGEGEKYSKIIELLSKYGANLSALRLYDRKSPLNILMEKGLHGKEKAKLLLSQDGININFVDEKGDSLLHNCVTFFDVEIMELLLINDADKNVVNRFGQTPFEYMKSKNPLMYKQMEHFENLSTMSIKGAKR